MDFSKNHPLIAHLRDRHRLSGGPEGGEKDVFGLTIDHGGQLRYEAGDWLAILPRNPPDAVDRLLDCLQWDGGRILPGKGETIRDALLNEYTIHRLSPATVEWLRSREPEPGKRMALERLEENSSPGSLDGFSLADLLISHCSGNLTGTDLLATLKPLQPRLYSLASAPHGHPRTARLVVSMALHGGRDGARRWGLASGYLNHHLRPGDPIRCYGVRSRFRLPEDPQTAIIMVGPGVGIAPFLGFLEQREWDCRHLPHPGPSWLFFGDRHRATDFLCEKELGNYLKNGTLTRLSLAFSRDQEQKIYVQDRMEENGAEIWSWLEGGAHFYVCGDASRMAGDVEKTLIQIIASHGNRSLEQASLFVEALRTNRRYQRDVY
jgi:sulfite reductase (NADPH) flavoprotein alpha-component